MSVAGRSPAGWASPSWSEASGASKALDRAADAVVRAMTRLVYPMLGGLLISLYLWISVNGGVTDLLYGWSRSLPVVDLPYADGEHYRLHPFQEMFFPLRIQDDDRHGGSRRRRSLVVFTSGRSGLENVDSLVRSWGLQHYDYVICHFDDSQAEWSKLDWYKHAVGFRANRQAKMWFFKRALSPWLVQGYEYVHFIDSDAGSPPEQPFHLAEYEAKLIEAGVVLGQPAVTVKEKSSEHLACRQQAGSRLRWTNFVENGPFFSVHVPDHAFSKLWEMVNPAAVSGYGVDIFWCAYLSEKYGFPRHRTCAVVDDHPIDHLDTRSATGQSFGGGREGKGEEQHGYAFFGFREWAHYGQVLSGVMRGRLRPTTYGSVPK